MRRLLALMMCAVSLGAAAQLPDYVPTDGLVAWYPLDGNVEADGEGGQDGLNFEAQASEDRNGNSSSAMLFVSTELDRVELGHGFATVDQPKSFAFVGKSATQSTDKALFNSLLTRECHIVKGLVDTLFGKAKTTRETGRLTHSRKQMIFWQQVWQ